MRVRNDAHFVVDGDGGAVQELELLTRFAPAHLQTALNFVEVEDVRRTAQLKHHVVRDINQGTDAALTAAGQVVHHPCRRLRLGVHTTHHTA